VILFALVVAVYIPAFHLGLGWIFGYVLMYGVFGVPGFSADVQIMVGFFDVVVMFARLGLVDRVRRGRM
jgi:hypothetical protein